MKFTLAFLIVAATAILVASMDPQAAKRERAKQEREAELRQIRAFDRPLGNLVAIMDSGRVLGATLVRKAALKAALAEPSRAEQSGTSKDIRKEARNAQLKAEESYRLQLHQSVETAIRGINAGHRKQSLDNMECMREARDNMERAKSVLPPEKFAMWVLLRAEHARQRLTPGDLAKWILGNMALAKSVLTPEDFAKWVFIGQSGNPEEFAIMERARQEVTAEEFAEWALVECAPENLTPEDLYAALLERPKKLLIESVLRLFAASPYYFKEFLAKPEVGICKEGDLDYMIIDGIKHANDDRLQNALRAASAE